MPPSEEMVKVDASQHPAILQDLLKSLDTAGKGYVNAEDVDVAIQAVRVRQSGAGLKGVSSSVLQGLGITGDRVTVKDLNFVHQATTKMKEEKQATRRLLFALVALLLLLTAAMFGVSFAAAYLAKDMHVDDDAVVRVGSGDVALMGSADTMVVNGTLSSRSDSQVCNAEGGCSRHAVATRKAEEGHKLSSRIADEIFANLDRIDFAISPPAGITTQLTLRLHGFYRARNDNSVCGTVVHLITLHGTLTLDDQALHLDDQLSSYLASNGLDGIVLAQGQATGHGRRLQEGTVSALGIFNYFDNLEFKCEHPGVQKPRTPRLPYMATMLKKRPCVSKGACRSTLLAPRQLPGYDAASDAIITSHIAVVTETKKLTVDQFPNHPGQELLTIIDHVAQTTETFQFSRYAGEEMNGVHRCGSQKYSATPEIGLEDAWWVTYLGEGYREPASYNIAGITHDVPATTNRVFRLASKNSTSGKDAVDFEDDPVTLRPKRMFLRQARSVGMDVEEVLYTDFQELDEASASAEMAKFNDYMQCPDAVSERFPEVSDDVFTEMEYDVLFYAHDFHDDEEWRDRLDGYWQHAISVFGSDGFDDFEDITPVVFNFSNDDDALNNGTDDSEERRQLSTPRRLQKPGLDSTGPEIHRRRVYVDGGHRRRGVVIPPPPFSDTPPNPEYYETDPTEIYAKTFDFGTSALKYEMFWPNGGGYICYRVTGKNSGSSNVGWFATGGLAVGDYCEEKGNFAIEGRVQVGYAWYVEVDFGVITAGCDLSVDGFIEGAKSTYKYNCGPRRRRAGRRRQCNQAGGKLAAGINIDGFCGISAGGSGVGVGVSGQLKFAFGPFPKMPLNAKATGELKAWACIQIIETLCIGVGSWKFFSQDLGATRSR